MFTHLQFILLLLTFSLCEVPGEKLMVRNQVEQMEERQGCRPLQGTECDRIGGSCYNNNVPMNECNGVVYDNPNICNSNECYCCLEHEARAICSATVECNKNQDDPGQCVDDVQGYIELKTYYVSQLNCEGPDCSCVHRCREDLTCRQFGGRCFLNEVTNCRIGYTMLQGCGCENVNTCGCCVP
ncbi:hypothetical protein Pcinc_021596, partial [Petrolisthes cinctipes]